MKWIEKVASSLAFAGLLLGIVFVFDDKLQIPVWLQVAGRMHPLLLHLPITLLLISIISYFIPSNSSTNNIFSYVRLFGALTAILQLSWVFYWPQKKARVETLYSGTSGQVLQQLCQLGYFIVMQALYNPIKIIYFKWCITVFLTITTGHFGATLTHGEGFLTAPLYKMSQALTLAEARIYPNVVATIFKEKCGTCHNNSNKKVACL